MKIRFKIQYKTQWGQSLNLYLHAKDNSVEKYGMQSNEKSEWNVDIQIDPTETIAYQYAVQSPEKPLEYEYGGVRCLNLLSINDTVQIIDSWRSSFGDRPFLSTAFSDCFFKRNTVKIDSIVYSKQLILRLNCPQMEPDRHFALVGNQDSLGNWNVENKVRMDESQFPVWSTSLDAENIKFPLEYKYLLVNTKTDEVLAWGIGPNLSIDETDTTITTVITDEHFIRTIPSWRGTGVAIPVFSLRSEDSFGIGEFSDILKMVDWAKKTGQKIIQILPVNDTTLHHTDSDSYPYNAVSVFALHPAYLHLESLGKLTSNKANEYFLSKKSELNAKNFSDYHNVLDAKWEYFKLIYPQESPAVFDSKDYKLFFESNREWLVPYAVFSYLRDLNGTPEFRNWTNYNVYNEPEIQAFSEKNSPYYHEIAIYYFLQYHLHKQLVEVHTYARDNGIAIKGDIPIGVSPMSVDVWVHPELFNTNVQAGAPPDNFSATGQNWGFPTYNWELMEKDGYQWWRKRFQKLTEYFDAYRIDHILGFFRIWEIPIDDVWGLTGTFHPALPLTRKDIESNGLLWDENRFLKPFMKEPFIRATFGKYTREVIQDYLLTDDWQNYKFKPEFDTQKKIEAHFDTGKINLGEKEKFIRNGLYTLLCEVLFIRDSRQQDKFHPRISMQHSATFKDMSIENQRILERISNDFFYRRHTEFWKQQALKKLPALISATNMLVCGEDLGMIPDSVPDVMNELEILSLEIQRMPKKPNMEFGFPSEAPYRSVCTTSTHDMNPIRAWWEEDPALTQRFYTNILNLQGIAPATCTGEMVEKIIEQHLLSNAMWIILPWQDWMGLDEDLRMKDPLSERINVPDNPHNFWCYRMHITLEKLLTEDNINKKIKEMIQVSSR